MIDRVLRLLVGLAGAVAIVLAVVAGRSDLGRGRIEELTRTAEEYRQADRVLQREIVNTRTGLSPSYDKMNAAMIDAASAIDRLMAAAQGDARLEAAAGRLQRRVAARADQIERYKTASALLQNALARFSNLSSESLRIPAVGTLSSAILRLSIENDAAAVDDARRFLRVGEATGRLPGAVVVQGELLTALLPGVRAQLMELRVSRPEDDLAIVDALIAERMRAARAERSSSYLALLASVLLAAFGTILLVARGVDRVRRLRRKSAGERLSGTVARLLLAADGLPFEGHVTRALERIAKHADTPLVFLALFTEDDDRYLSWPDQSAETMATFEQLVATTRRSSDWRNDALVYPTQDGALGAERLLLLRQVGPISATLAIALSGGEESVDSDAMIAARLALAAVIQAAAREAVEAERIELERQLAHAEGMKAIGVIASGVAHNFNNITGAIGGFAEMARGKMRRGSVTAGHLDEIISAVGRARALVDDILGYAGSKPAQVERVRIVDLLCETMRLLRVSYGDGATVTFDAAADPVVIVNASRLQQVFMNICNNAVAVTSGHARIDLGVRTEQFARARQFSRAKLPPGDYAVVTIADNGPGIPPDILPRMFEPFFTTRPSGTGLGLSTAWQIVTGHGGTIEVTSGALGSRFYIWLPVATADGEAPSPGHGERILLLASDMCAGDYEDRLARLGYEPVFLGYSALETGLADVIGNVDAIVAVNPPPSAAALLERRAPADLPFLAFEDRGGDPRNFETRLRELDAAAER